MKPKVMNVGVSTASMWLSRNDVNRSLRKGLVRTYAREMYEGRWQDSPEPIVLNGDGTLLDGQHRLNALLLANKMARDAGKQPITIRILLVEDVPKSVFPVLGQGAGRSPRDLVKAMGMPKAYPSILRAMVAHTRPMQLEGRMLNSFMQRLETDFGDAALSVAIVAGDVRAPATSPVLAVAARAMVCGEDVANIERFIRILKTNVPETGADGETTALAFARYVISVSSGGGSSQRDITLKAERALKAFLDNERLTKIFAAKDNPWPIYVA